MEPARKKVTFEQLDGKVILVDYSKHRSHTTDLYSLGGEVFADYYGSFIALYKDGFTTADNIKWEHFVEPAVNIRCNSLGRIVHA